MEEPLLPPPPPLLAVTFVFQSRKIFDVLVLDKATSFLDSAVEMALCDACKFGSVALLDRIWNSCTSESEPSPADAGPGNGGRWSRRKYLRTDPHYNRFQFRLSMVEAVKHKGLEVTRWLFNHFSGCIVPFVAVRNAAYDGKLDLLRFFLAHDIRAGNGALASQHDGLRGDMTRYKGKHFVRWGHHDVSAAANNKQHETIWWLYRHTKGPRWLKQALLETTFNGDIVLLDWFVAHCRTRGVIPDEEDEVGDPDIREGGFDDPGEERGAVGQAVAAEDVANALRTLRAAGMLVGDVDALAPFLTPPLDYDNALDFAVFDGVGDFEGENARELIRGDPHIFARYVGYGGHLSALEWMHENGFLRGGAKPQLCHAIDKGGLDMVEWMISHKMVEAGRAMALAASYSCLDMAKRLYHRYWQQIRSQPYFPLRGSSISEWSPQWYEGETAWVSKGTLASAARRGNLALVKWIVETFSSAYDLFNERPTNHTGWGKHHLIDVAALSGSVETVEYLHKLALKNQPSNTKPRRKKQKQASTLVLAGPTCSTEAMDNAAKENHLNVVQWLHKNRTEGCTVAAMDQAAEKGHLEMVQWLHSNRTEGCTTKAMDLAASSGRLDVVKWLHGNRPEGCTTEAMDGAASGGYLHVVQWLHANRSEGCTVKAMDDAAYYGHLKVVDWLHKNRSEGCSANLMDRVAKVGRLNVVKWLHVHRSEGCTAAAMDEAACWVPASLDVVLFLHSQRGEGCSAEAFRKTRKCSPWGDMHETDSDHPSDNIHDWLVEHYPNVNPSAA